MHDSLTPVAPDAQLFLRISVYTCMHVLKRDDCSVNEVTACGDAQNELHTLTPACSHGAASSLGSRQMASVKTGQQGMCNYLKYSCSLLKYCADDIPTLPVILKRKFFAGLNVLKVIKL